MSMIIYSFAMASSIVLFHALYVQKSRPTARPKRIRVMTPEEEAHHRAHTPPRQH